jgi:hypothetical protein
MPVVIRKKANKSLEQLEAQSNVIDEARGVHELQAA